jgi:hypothetical protein
MDRVLFPDYLCASKDTGTNSLSHCVTTGLCLATEPCYRTTYGAKDLFL